MYFSDPEDLIPDDIEVIGLLDDAIVLEILVRRLRHVLQAYADFRAYCDALDAPASPARVTPMRGNWRVGATHCVRACGAGANASR